VKHHRVNINNVQLITGSDVSSETSQSEY